MKNTGQRMLDMTWEPWGIKSPVPEWRFHPVRRWRFDYAWVDKKIAVEVDGGAWSRGRHTRGTGFIADMEKSNVANAMGWHVYRFTPQQIKSGEAQTFLSKIF